MSWDRMQSRRRSTEALKEIAIQQHETGVDETGKTIYKPGVWNPLLLSNGQFLELSDGTVLELNTA